MQPEPAVSVRVVVLNFRAYHRVLAELGVNDSQHMLGLGGVANRCVRTKVSVSEWARGSGKLGDGEQVC